MVEDGAPYDAVVVVSFGGPEGPDDVAPFLANVTRGRDVPPERLAEVAERYQRFGGVSPLNASVRRFVAALEAELAARGRPLPVYWGNRNWRPFLADTVAEMAAAGVTRALAFVTSAFGSYSSCRQYLEDLEAARRVVGPAAPELHKLRLFYNHPRFVAAQAADLARALSRPGWGDARLVFTAHSIPAAMAAGCSYEAQLREACRLTAAAAGRAGGWTLAYQSRSGPAQVPWLGPDILDALRAAAAEGARRVVVTPVGFVADHFEVVWDLDVEAAAVAAGLGLELDRTATGGDRPELVALAAELVEERLDPGRPRAVLGALGAWPDACPADCCAPPGPRSRPGRRD
ncbi:MAG: ferrochelatase [Acidimicrobiales bacterium]